MVNDEEYQQYMEENTMLINPVERYCIEKGREEGREEGIKEGRDEGKLFVARNLIEDGCSIDYVLKLTGLSKKDLDKI